MTTNTFPRANPFIGITTPHFKECADFYIRHFGFTVNAESADFVIVQAPNGKRVMGFGAPSEKRAQMETFSGGMHLAFLVEDAAAAMEVFKEAGVPITRGIKIESWGEKHFVITDPAGIEVYVSEACGLQTVPPAE